MVMTTSLDLPLGAAAPDFSLPDVQSGRQFSLADCKQQGCKGLLVLFICNHCPYVKMLRTELAAIGREYSAKGVSVLAVCSNDADRYPDDGPEQMRAVAQEFGYSFPYLHDADQSVARAYGAVCTPDIFLFDADFRLFYHGQFDDARPNKSIPVTGQDLRQALDALLSGKSAPAGQKPSVGCSIKWKPGKGPEPGQR